MPLGPGRVSLQRTLRQGWQETGGADDTCLGVPGGDACFCWAVKLMWGSPGRARRGLPWGRGHLDGQLLESLTRGLSAAAGIGILACCATRVGPRFAVRPTHGQTPSVALGRSPAWMTDWV